MIIWRLRNAWVPHSAAESSLYAESPSLRVGRTESLCFKETPQVALMHPRVWELQVSLEEGGLDVFLSLGPC